MERASSRIMALEESQTLAFEGRAKEMAGRGIDVISLCAGEPDFMTPSNISKAAKKAIDSGLTKYTPTSGILELRQAIARKLKTENNLEYSPSQIIVSCGAKHSLYNAIMAVLNPGDEAIIPVPYWVSYGEQVKLAGAKPVFAPCFPGHGFTVTADAIAKKITPKTRLIILNSPNNPSGNVIPKKELSKIASLAVSKGIFIISDEIYEKLIFADESQKQAYSIASHSEEMKGLAITINGVSKSYSMTGWRIGYAAGPQDIISAMAKLQSQMTSNPSSISQYAALEALNGSQASVEKMRLEFRKRRDYCMGRIASIKGMECGMPDGAFYLFPDISKIEKNSLKFAESLLEKANVAVVPGSAFGMDGHIRISYATSMKSLEKAFDRIEAFAKGYSGR